MRIAPNLNFTVVEPTKKSLSSFVQMIKNVYQNFSQAFNGQIGFGDGTLPDNINGSWINVVAPVAPNTDFTVNHNLQRIPSGYWIMQKDRACDVYTGGVAATATAITLRATVASAVLRLFIISLLLFIPFSVRAQNTNVSATITDAGGQVWINGNYTFNFVPSPRFNGIYRQNGVPFTPPVIKGSLDSGGAFTNVAVPDTNQITPAGTGWSVTVCTQLGFFCFTSNSIVITGASQNITANITPPAPSIPCGPGVKAYVDSELLCGVGGSYYSLVLGQLRQCTLGTDPVCITWVSGTGTGVPGGSPVQTQVNNSGAFGGAACQNFTDKDVGPINNNCNTAFKGPNPYVDATLFGVRAVSSFSTTANCNNGSPNVTLASASSFKNGDGVALYGCGSDTIGVPAAPTVAPSLAVGQTGLLLDVPGLVGATTYCYQLVARSLMGATNVSSETCTATGPASLGLQTNTITSCTLTLNVMNCLTSAPHGLVVGALAVVQGTAVNLFRGQANGGTTLNPFDGWFRVATVPDSTHFTVNLYADTRNGSVAAGTGGTLSYWNTIRITATETTNNYQYYIYGRVSGGTKILIGTMWPQDTALLGRLTDPTYLAFEDFGSPVTTFPNPPLYIPTVVPTAPTNGMLATTIASGAGTTSLTLANNAGNTISGQTIIFDDAVTFLAAATYAANAAGGTLGPVMLPEPGNSGLGYIFNSPISLGTGATSRVAVLQKGALTINEPVILNFVPWYGVTSSKQLAAGFSNLYAPIVNFGKASPGFFANTNPYFYNLSWNFLSGNGATMLIQESGGIPAAAAFRDMSFSTTFNAFSNMALVLRGNGAGYDFTNTTLTSGQIGNITATTPGMYFDGIGNVSFSTLSMSGVGIAFRVNPAGQSLIADNVYSQGNYEPYFSLARDTTDANAIFVATSRQIIFDTTFVPFIANYGGHALTLDLVNSTASGQPHVTGSDNRINLHLNGSTGTTSNIGVSTLNVSAGAFDGTLGGVNIPTDTINKNISQGPAFSFFSNTGPPTAPTCPVSAGGAVPIGANFYFYSPVYANGSQGALSFACIATTTGGNQTVTLNWTVIPGVTQYGVYRGTFLGSVVRLPCAVITGTTFVDTAAAPCGGSAQLIPAGGPAGLHGDLVWGNKVQAGVVTANLGIPCTNGEISLSAGWQSTGAATVTAVAGTSQTCSWTITTGTTTAANPTVTDTLTNLLPNATTVCELNIHGGTHTALAGENFQQTTLSATAPIFTANFTPTAAGATYFVTRRCGP